MKKLILIILLFSLQVCYPKWQKLSNPLNPYSDKYSIAVNNSTIFIGTNFPGIYLSNDNGESWQESRNGLYALVCKDIIVEKNIIFCITGGFPYGGFIYKSTNNGESWEWITPGGGENYWDAKTYIGSFAVNKDTLIAAPADSIDADSNRVMYISYDRGENWININTDLHYVYGDGINKIVFNNTDIIATSSNNVYLSRDNAAHWVKKVADFGGAYIFSLYSYEGKIYVGTGNGLFESSNNGDIWGKIELDSHKHTVSAIKIIGDTLIVGTYNNDGLYLSTNNGINWENIGLNEGDIFDIAIKDDFIFVCVDSLVYRAKLDDVITGVKTENVQDQSQISVIPNPAEHSISISFYNEVEQPCIITLSNTLPLEVFKQEINAIKGQNNLTIPTAGLSDGMYFLTIKFKDKSLSQKVIIIK